MSAPRPSEADVEAEWFEGGDGHGYRYQYIGPIHYLCECGAYFLNRDRWIGHKAVADRDAEHEREVAALRGFRDECERQYQAKVEELGNEMNRAEAAERALADRDAAIKAVREFCEEHQRQWNPGMEKAQQFTFDGGVGAAAQDVLDLLPRDDAAGAGGDA